MDNYLLFLQKFKFEFSKDNQSQGYITIESLEELIDLKKTIDCQLIITSDYNENPAIEIYDDYRE
jgi:hypothetical protein